MDGLCCAGLVQPDTCNRLAKAIELNMSPCSLYHARTTLVTIHQEPLVEPLPSRPLLHAPCGVVKCRVIMEELRQNYLTSVDPQVPRYAGLFFQDVNAHLASCTVWEALGLANTPSTFLLPTHLHHPGFS